MQTSFNVLAVAVLLAALPGCLLAAKESEECCADLGLPTGQGNSDVCATADLPDIGCKKAVTGKKAAKICKDAGTRLCTRQELRNKEGKGVGCGLNNRLVWTSSKCDGKGTAWVALGKNGKERECFPKKDAEFKAAVICCADACDSTEDEVTTFYVGEGDFPSPFYPFFSDPAGENPVETPTLEAGRKYRFELIVGNFFHPFGIGFSFRDTSLTDRLTSSGSFVEFTAEPGLMYFCFAHSSMQALLPVIA